ncbi:MAG: radical SAM protein [bacterium]|jgi:MoaA/NifB/PqqE/SkfB family radical SAM enzyme|nr:radical SAM protein [bacterium]
MKIRKSINIIQAYLDLLLKRKRPKAYPLELSVGTTSYCNLNCIQCPRAENEGNLMPKDVRLSMEYYQGLEPYLKRANEVSLYGLGEPLIDKDYFEKVRYVTSFGANVSLSTNGTLMDEAKCRKLIESGIRAIGISLDASTPEVFAVVRPPGGFEKIIENIKTLARLKAELGAERPVLLLSFGIMRQNLHDLAAFPALAKAVGASELVVHPVTYQSPHQKETLAVDWQDLLCEVESARCQAEELGLRFYFWDIDPDCYLKALAHAKTWQEKRPDPPTDPPQKPAYCAFLWRNAMIQGKGEVFPCCYITNLRLGRLPDEELFVLRAHPFLQDLKRRLMEGHPPEVCAQCPQLVSYQRKKILRQGWTELKQLWKIG